MVTCEFCKEPLLVDRGTYRFISGWEQPRAQGGANKVTLREVHDRYAHPNCIRLAQLKVHPDQGALFAP